MDILKDNNVLDYLYLITFDVHNFAEIYDHTSLTKLSLTIFPNDTESLELDRLGELDRLEFVYLSINSDKEMKYDLSAFAKCDNIKRLVLTTEAESYDFLLDMDSLEELIVFDTKFSAEIEQALEDKGVTLEYKE